LGSDPNCFVIPDLIRDPWVLWFAGVALTLAVL
jgi:hypothetical protein